MFGLLRLTIKIMCFTAALYCYCAPLNAKSSHGHHHAAVLPSQKKSHRNPNQKNKMKSIDRNAPLLTFSSGQSVKLPEETITPTAISLTPSEGPPYYDVNRVTPDNKSTLKFQRPDNLVDFVNRTVQTLRYSDYKLGGSRFDPNKGIYVVDCSNYVDHLLQIVTPEAFNSLVNSCGSEKPTTAHYYDFFKGLTPDRGSRWWNKVNDVDALRPGDILVFRYKPHRGSERGGHIMVVMDKPMRHADTYFVRVADSAPARHSKDTRQRYEGGIGIGTLLLKANPKTGQPSAYAWGLGAYWNNNVNFAMARPLDSHFNG